MRVYIQILSYISFFMYVVAHIQAQPVHFVNINASGNNNGRMWTDAFVNLQDALEVAQEGDEIWVAQGTYYPDQGINVNLDDRLESFVLKSGISLYGGFRGDESYREMRNWETNPTILSGDLLQNDNGIIDLQEPTRSDNSFHVIVADINVTYTTVVDGFVVSCGHADGTVSGNNNFGGGLFNAGDLKVVNVNFIANSARIGGGVYTANKIYMENIFFYNNLSENGGGMVDAHGISELYMVEFRDNISHGIGGAMSTDRASSTMFDVLFVNNTGAVGGAINNRKGKQIVINGKFIGNRSNLGHGGAILNDENSIIIANILLSGNVSASDGGGIYNFGCSCTILQATLSGNISNGAGGGIYNKENHPDPPLVSGLQKISNSILWDNVGSGLSNQIFDDGNSLTVETSIVEGGLPFGINDGGGNLSSDPVFINALGEDGILGTEDDDLHLSLNSPAIDSGKNEAIITDSIDIDNDGVYAETLPFDLDYKLRIYNGGSGLAVVDIGAYEFGASSILSNHNQKPLNQENDHTIQWYIYPNPTQSFTNSRLIFDHSTDVQMTMYDVTGRFIKVLSAHKVVAHTDEIMRINLSELSNGIYFITLTSDQFQYSRMIVLQR